jgi:hypothetical protein
LSKTLEAAQKERDRLARIYKIEKARQMKALCADPIYGHRLHSFVATLNHFGPDHAERMIAYVRWQNDLWLKFAENNIRAAALEAIGERIVRIRELARLVPFDDALPGEPDDVWQVCLGILIQE